MVVALKRQHANQTTIVLEKETRQLLQKVGRKEQTYDDLIRELVVKQRTCEKCGKIIEYSMPGSGLAPAPRQLTSVDLSKETHG
jgi:hypothetical protein